jgi:hypothetical protein
MFAFTARRLDTYLISVLLALGMVALLSGTARGDYRVVNRTEGVLRVAVFEPQDMGRIAGNGWQMIGPGEAAAVSSCARPVIGILVQDDATGEVLTPPDVLRTVTKPVFALGTFTVAEGEEPFDLIRLTWGMPPTVQLIPGDWSSGDLPDAWYAAELFIVPSDGTFEVSPADEPETP